MKHHYFPGSDGSEGHGTGSGKNKKMAFLGEMSAVLAHELRNPWRRSAVRFSFSGVICPRQGRQEMMTSSSGAKPLETLVRDFFSGSVKGAVRVDAIDAIDVVDMINECWSRSGW